MMEIRDQDFYQNGQGNTLERYVENEDTTDAEQPYITKTDLMECLEMYEFDFQ